MRDRVERVSSILEGTKVPYLFSAASWIRWSAKVGLLGWGRMTGTDPSLCSVRQLAETALVLGGGGDFLRSYGLCSLIVR